MAKIINREKGITVMENDTLNCFGVVDWLFRATECNQKVEVHWWGNVHEFIRSYFAHPTAKFRTINEMLTEVEGIGDSRYDWEVYTVNDKYHIVDRNYGVVGSEDNVEFWNKILHEFYPEYDVED